MPATASFPLYKNEGETHCIDTKSVRDESAIIRTISECKMADDLKWPNPQFTSRFVGAILGFGIGDALGMPTQFLTRGQIKRYYGKPVSDFVKAHPGHASDFLASGCYTDDTQITLATDERRDECHKMDHTSQAAARP